MPKKREQDLTPVEADRVRTLLRALRDERFEGVNAQLGEALGITGQALSQNLRADHPTVPRFDTARRAAKLAGYDGVWDLLWPELRKAGEPRSHFDVAADVARREGWAEDVIDELRTEAAFNPERTPLHWIDRMRGRALSMPAQVQRVAVHEADIAPAVPPGPRGERFADRVRAAMKHAGLTVETLSRATKKLAADRGRYFGVKDLEMLLNGLTLGASERDAVRSIRAVTGVDERWLGSPASDVAESAIQKLEPLAAPKPKHRRSAG